jgi:8-amino-3,8-dideoxy-alpha-D-manno-octulosonate transaminase
MTEVQGVLGLTQLGKLDLILERQRANKAVIKDGIADCGFEFRHLRDEKGETADTLIFFLESEAVAATFAKKLAERGLGTKNLPDALIWHYAGTWQHLFGDFPGLVRCETLWPRTDRLLKRAIALPIMVKMDEASLDRVVTSVREIAKQR